MPPEPVKSVKSPVKPLYSPKQEKVATPSKEELARRWLLDHKNDRDLSSRELSNTRMPQGVKISHVTWNKIKQELGKAKQR